MKREFCMKFLKLVLLVLILTPTKFISQELTDLYVHSPNGIMLRDKPSTKGKIIEKVPYAEKVVFINYSDNKEIINGNTSYWYKIKYKGTTGWSFGAYLSSEIPRTSKLSKPVYISQFKLKKMNRSVSEIEIKNLFGSDYKIINPNYECGFHSQEQGQDYYQLIFKDLTFIGNDTENYIIEKIIFNSSTKYKLEYESYSIDYTTTLNELFEFLGKERFNKIEHNSPVEEKYSVPCSAASDDAYIIIIGKDRKIKELEYWSPC